MVSEFLRATARPVSMLGRILRRLRMIPLRPRFAAYGKNFLFDPSGTYTYASISVGDHVNLGVRPTSVAARSRIVIGDHVMLGPEVAIFGGGHNVSEVGTPVTSVHWKRGNEDLGVSIGSDVWIGTRAVILKGADVGRGAVVAAAAVVTKCVPDYAVVAGNPAKIVGRRFTYEEALAHEVQIYGAVSEERARQLRELMATDHMIPRRQDSL